MVEGKVLMGTCGWSDESILRCGRFYPSGIKTAEERLAVYSKHFPCVEVRGRSSSMPHAHLDLRLHAAKAIMVSTT